MNETGDEVRAVLMHEGGRRMPIDKARAKDIVRTVL